MRNINVASRRVTYLFLYYSTFVLPSIKFTRLLYSFFFDLLSKAKVCERYLQYHYHFNSRAQFEQKAGIAVAYNNFVNSIAGRHKIMMAK